MSTAAVVLAAGGSVRFRDGAKLAALSADVRSLWAVDAALEASLDQTIVVTGAAEDRKSPVQVPMDGGLLS